MLTWFILYYKILDLEESLDTIWSNSLHDA